VNPISDNAGVYSNDAQNEDVNMERENDDQLDRACLGAQYLHSELSQNLRVSSAFARRFFLILISLLPDHARYANIKDSKTPINNAIIQPFIENDPLGGAIK
jgi:hypothetical protein